MSPPLILTIAVLSVLLVVLVLVAVFLVRLLVVGPAQRIERVEERVGERLDGIVEEVSALRGDMAGVKSVLSRVERIVNLMIDEALNAKQRQV